MDGKKNDLLWHYCKYSVFELILKDKKIRLSDVKQCLDKQEIKYARKQYCKLLNKDIKPIIDTAPKESAEFCAAFSARTIVSKLSSHHICWIICFSESDENERLWEEYGDNSTGISIGFNVYALINNNSRIELIPSDIVYGKDDVKRIYSEKCETVRQIISSTFNKYAEIFKSFPGTEREREIKRQILSHECYSQVIDLLLTDFASFKRPEFSWEKEKRLTLTSTNLRKSLVAKGAELHKTNVKNKWCYVSFDLTYAIKAITIGKKSQYTVNDIEDFLKEKCFLTSKEIKKITIKKL